VSKRQRTFERTQSSTKNDVLTPRKHPNTPLLYSGAVNASVPKLLQRLRTGDESALNELADALYDEMRRLAARHLQGERPNHTLQTTALVHEVFLKLCEGSEPAFTDKVHFMAVASRVMRQVLVDYARARATKKRAGKLKEWTTSLQVSGDSGVELVDLIGLDTALDALAREDESLARLIEMRYFGGMTADETAEALGTTIHIVRHDLRLAEAWLRRKLGRPRRAAAN
jgi:RNA polymerase sigma factor (TIGR02999 family)